MSAFRFLRRPSRGVAAILAVLVGACSSDLGSERYEPDQRSLQNGFEVLAIALLGHNCGGCTQEELPERIEAIKVHLRDAAARKGFKFVAVGVDIAWDPKDGIRFLDKFGEFDEYIVGRNWFNHGSTRYLVRDLPGQPTIPQIVVVGQDVKFEGASLSIGDQVVLARLVGNEQIEDWETQLLRQLAVAPRYRDAPDVERDTQDTSVSVAE